MPFGVLIVNRVNAAPGAEPDAAALAAELGEALARKVVRAVSDARLLADRDAAAIARLRAEIGGAEPVLVPQLDGDVHDVDGLVAVHGHLFAPDGS
jgi:hypothetical protein